MKKKSKHGRGLNRYSSWFKRLLIMKAIVALVCVIGLMSSYADSDAQVSKLNFQIKKGTVKDVLETIEEQTGLSFMYDNTLFDVNRSISLSVDNESVEKVLEKLLVSENLKYEKVNRYIVITSGSQGQVKQQQKVTGKVTDSSGSPLPGVAIVIKGTTQGTVTNAEGNYSLPNVPGNATLQFSFVGMRSQEIPAENQASIDVVMGEDVIGLDEVVAVGYGTMKKSDITGSVQHVDVARYQNQHTTNMVEMLSGTVAGFNSNQETSAAGGGSLEVRGPTSLAADTNPLIVLDGVIYNGNIGDINPNDIESVDILKDASSAAIFGARSASGVLIITTKRGKTSKPTINFSSKAGISGITHHLYPQSPEQYLIARGDYWAGVFQGKPEQYYKNPNNLPSYVSLEEWQNYDVTSSDDPVETWFNRLGMTQIELDNYKAGKTVNWYDKVFRNGIRQDYDLSLSGRTTALRYYWSAGYTDNQGVLLGDDYKTIRSRINIDADVTDFLSVGVNVQFADIDQSSQNSSFANALEVSPYGNMYEEDGKTLTFYPNGDRLGINPLIYYENRDKLNLTQNLFATLFGEIKLPYGLSYKVSFVNRYSWNKNHYFDPLTTPNGLNNQGYGSRIDNSTYEWQVDNIFSWQKTIADIHKLNATFLVNAEKFQSWQSIQENSQFAPSGALSYHALQAGISPSLSNDDQYSTGNALMARLNYTLLDRYMVTATWRRDGYSAFGQKHPYAEFPSVALGWAISEEKFFNVHWISRLKLRASLGVNGNRAVGRYEALARLGTTKYIYGTTLATGVFSSTMANSDLRWEKTEALNFGLDFGLFKNVVSGAMEYYDMTTRDLLLNRSLPSIIGYTSVASNLGELGNKGFELTLNSTNVNKQNFNWNSSLVFSFNRNKIKHLYGEMIDVLDGEGNVVGQKEADDIENNWFIDQSLDRIWDYEVLGVWQLEESEQAAVYGKQPGDMKLRDVNNDGILNPADDKIFQGYKRPQYRIGLRNDFIVFKNFEISAFIRADLGFYRANNLHRNTESANSYERLNFLVIDYWTKNNPINDYARLNSNAAPGFNYWENSSFVRLQDLTVSYNVPKSKLMKYQVQDLKVFLSFRNLLTFTGWKHYDPESGTTMMPKVSSIGVNITL